jgi:hypothetical protein
MAPISEHLQPCGRRAHYLLRRLPRRYPGSAVEEAREGDPQTRLGLT